MKNQGTPKVNGKNWNEMMERELGEEKSNVKGVGYRWMFDIDYLTDSMNYIPVSLENQTNPHAGTSEVTNSAGTLQTPSCTMAYEKKMSLEELLLVPIAVRHTASKVGPRKSSTNSKAEEFLIELQNLKTQEKEAYSTGISEDTPEILAFRRELDELAPKHLREVPKNKATSTTSVNSGSGSVNSQHAAGRKLKRFMKALKDEPVGFELCKRSCYILGCNKYDSSRSTLMEQRGVVSQPSGFVDPDHHKKVYKVVKSLYGLHQAPRAWYATLSTFLEKHGYRRGTIYMTLFIKKDKKDIMLVQVYVDDIIFGSTRNHAKDRGNFYFQDKYVADMLEKFNYAVTPKDFTLNAYQAVDQPSPSEPLPSSSHLPVISATTESEPTPIAEPTPHPKSPSPKPDSEPIEHTFEQPSPEHQPLSPIQETEVPQSQDPTHPYVAEERTMTVDDLLQLVPNTGEMEKKVKKMECSQKENDGFYLFYEDEDADISSKQGRNLQEEGEEDISPTTLEAAKTLSKVASQRSKSVDKGKRYKRRKESKGKDIDTGFEDISTGFEEVNTGGLGVSTGSGPVSSD
ncbi:retrovirus-related pol polyprotein from transposon TNT 1-94 [Tanacetum coccineum]